MKGTLCALALLAGFLSAHAATAAQLSRPQVEYSADSTMQTEDMTLEEKVYYTPTKERHEMQGASTNAPAGMAQIFRYDNKVMWQLMPSEKMYMEHAMAKRKADDVSQWDFEETEMGDETLNGVKVTKYKTIATSTDGKKFGGFSWRTKEGIAVKQDLLYKEGNEKKRMATELKNLKIGKQDPTLFEVPKDYTKFDMAGMMGGMGGMMGGPGAREGMAHPGMGRPNRGQDERRPHMPVTPEDAPPTPEPPADDRSDAQKASDMMKKLFGR
jgi:uncharacterized protein DUF4412